MDALEHVHDRMPLIIPPAMLGQWLNPTIRDDTEVRGILEAIPDPELVPRKVSTAVNTVRNNHPELLAPVD